MSELVRSLPWRAEATDRPESLLSREWLVTNGLGGYASGTLAGVLTRRYHGLLIAALEAPYGRRVMLPDVAESIKENGDVIDISGEEPASDTLSLHGSKYLTEFRLEEGLPTWHFEINGVVLEKRLVLLHGQNTVHVTYRLLHGDRTLSLRLRPSLQFRPHEAPVSTPLHEPLIVTAIADEYEFSPAREDPVLRMKVVGSSPGFTFDQRHIQQILYRIEESRGYESHGDLWSPGYFHVELSPKANEATLIASTEEWYIIRALSPAEALDAERKRRQALLAKADLKAKTGMGAELVLAADQFVITPRGRSQDVARAHASGDEIRTIIAGYHWFTDWGRDTMISLEGLMLSTGRDTEAGWILRTFAYYIRDGLIPNMFPEGENEGLYHTADATLWFFHALDRYMEHCNDRITLALLLPKLRDIIDHHLRGTRFGIGVDPRDGLLRQGKKDYQLTWMDAKVDDWVVTPRRGKAVEINALWYNALRLLEQWEREESGDAAAKPYSEHAERVRRSFNERFWYEEGAYLYDIVDGENSGNDPALRPNQLFSFSLRYPVLDESRWERVLHVCQEKLLTPFGLRSLAPGSPEYKSKYYGDLRSRDAAYHQGTVWAWLIGPFINCWLRVHPGDRKGARRLLEGFSTELDRFGVGTIAEIFDAEEPYQSRGCIAQAWSVAEVLRCWVETAE